MPTKRASEKQTLPFRYKVYKKLRLVISIGSGRVTADEIKARQDETSTDPDFDPHFDQIVDLREVTGFDMSAEQLRTLARRRVFSGNSRRAFVGVSPSIYGTELLWQVHNEVSENPSQIRIFSDLRAALEWLEIADSSII